MLKLSTTTLTYLAIAGLVANRAVDFIRSAFDKRQRVPKAYWLLAAWALGIGEAYLVTSVTQIRVALGVPAGADVTTILLGLGFGSVGGFWHEVLSALSAVSGPSATPLGLKPKAKRAPVRPKKAA